MAMTAAERAAIKAENTARAASHIVRRGDREWIVPSRTTIGEVYIVTERSGVTTCNCPAAINGRRCWHIAAVEERFGVTLDAPMDAAKRVAPVAVDDSDPEWKRRGYLVDPAAALALLRGKKG